MKKLLLSSIVLLVFSLCLIVFQMSCQKTSFAQSPTSQLGKVLLKKQIQLQVGSTLDSLSGLTVPVYRYAVDFYLVQNDGTNLSKINMTLPAGEFAFGNAVLSPDGEKIIFDAMDVNNQSSVYSYALDGSGLIKLAEGMYQIQGAY